MRRIVSTCLAGALLAFGTVPALAADTQPLKVTKPDAAKGVSQVVIGAFNVGFLFESVDAQGGRAGGGLINAFSGPTRVKSVLEGVTPAMMQAITDAAYADFRKQLATRGFVVAEPDAMFAGALAKSKPLVAPYDASVATGKNSTAKTSFYKPAAIPAMVMLPGDMTADAGFAGFGAFADMGRAMAGAGAQAGMAAHARETGQAVLDIVYLIDFSDAKRPGAFSFSGIKVTSGLSVAGDYSKLNIIMPSGNVTAIVVKQPIAVEGDFATMADATRGFNKASETAVNVLGAFAGIGAGKSRKYAFTVKPGAYEEGATKAASLANTRLVEQLAALR